LILGDALISYRRTIPALALVLSFAAGFTAPGFSQSKTNENVPPTPAIKVRTEFVLIPAEVTDSQGNRVANMKKEDFVVLENGKRREIGFFEHVVTKAEIVKPEAPPEGVFTNAVAHGPNRVTIFVLDLINSRMEEQKEARKQLMDFLATSLDVREPVCLVAVDAKGVWLLHGFTTDTKLLVDAINHVKQQPAATDRPASDPEDQLFRTFQGGHGRSVTAIAATEEARVKMLQMAIGFQNANDDARVNLTLMSLQEIADAFVGIPGRKSMIWATAGFPLDMGDAGQLVNNLGDKGLTNLYEQTWRKLEAASIAVYPLDVSELVNPGFVDAGIGRSRPEHVTMDTRVANLENLADATGGRFCARNIDAKQCFDEAARDSSDYYMLGIYDQSATEKAGWRKLTVRTARSGVQVRARSGYYLRGPHEPENDTQVMDTALFSPFDYTGLPITVKFAGTAEGSRPGTKKVGFAYSIPPAAIRIDAEQGSQLKIEFAAVARDARGKMAGSFSKVVEGKMNEAQARQVQEKGILFTGEMQLPPGEYSLSFAVMDKINENTGSVTAPLKVQ
jgi:VWFA-related protein